MKAAEEHLSALRTQLAQQKAAADGRQASLEAQSAELQVPAAQNLNCRRFAPTDNSCADSSDHVA